MMDWFSYHIATVGSYISRKRGQYMPGHFSGSDMEIYEPPRKPHPEYRPYKSWSEHWNALLPLLITALVVGGGFLLISLLCEVAQP
jgi:hypothetical protein